MRAKQTYLLLERLEIIKNSIEAGFYPTSTALIQAVQKELGTEVSVSTVYRDIEFLRNRCGMRIAFDSAKKGYCITKGAV